MKKVDIGKLAYNIFVPLGFFLFYIIVIMFINLLFAFPLKWGWNYTMTYLFGLPVLTWSHSFVLLFILTILWKLSIVSVETKK